MIFNKKKIIGGTIGLITGITISLPLMVDNIGPVKKNSELVILSSWIIPTVIGIGIANFLEKSLF